MTDPLGLHRVSPHLATTTPDRAVLGLQQVLSKVQKLQLTAGKSVSWHAVAVTCELHTTARDGTCTYKLHPIPFSLRAFALHYIALHDNACAYALTVAFACIFRLRWCLQVAVEWIYVIITSLYVALQSITPRYMTWTALHQLQILLKPRVHTWTHPDMHACMDCRNTKHYVTQCYTKNALITVTYIMFQANMTKT